MPGTADAKDDVHRLRDIVVEEVSLVDRAANKRRFLVVKRSGEMPDGEDHELDETVDAGGEPESAGDDVAKASTPPPPVIVLSPSRASIRFELVVPVIRSPFELP